MAERRVTCGECANAILMLPGTKSITIICCAPLSMLAERVVFVSQMKTGQDTDASGCRLFRPKKEEED
jgi:hypothetical protein